MEPIGQKTALTYSEEALSTPDIEVEAGENEPAKIYDSTLDDMLAEETDPDTMLAELLDDEGKTALLT